jgi:hypothetical protein
LFFGEVGFAAEPVFHGGLKAVEGNAIAYFHGSVGGGERVVEDGVVGEVTHGEVVEPLYGARLGFRGVAEVIDCYVALEHRWALEELDKHGGIDGEGLGLVAKVAGGGVVGEDGDGGRTLVGAEEPAAGGVEGKVAGDVSAGVDALLLGEKAVVGDVVDGEGVGSAGVGVEGFAIGADG